MGEGGVVEQLEPLKMEVRGVTVSLDYTTFGCLLWKARVICSMFGLAVHLPSSAMYIFILIINLLLCKLNLSYFKFLLHVSLLKLVF